MTRWVARLLCTFAWLCTVALLGSTPARSAGGPDLKAPDPKRTGEVYEWKSKDGLAYQYIVPKGYDADRGANLTFILHGSNLDRRWGFANHPAGTFRPDDVVVCPDGTTPNQQGGGFNFLDRDQDDKRLFALHTELKAVFKVRATYVYGHSQGSFFAFRYAGEHPEDVQGVVGHASGVWAGTAAPKAGHAQAIVLMHGTADPVVPYSQSEGGLAFYREANYPLVRLRSLQGWNHWPAEVNGGLDGEVVPHTSQQLAWCEGMTSADPERVGRAFDFLADIDAKGWHDYAALRSLAVRVRDLDSMDDKRRKRAAAAIEAVDALAVAHVAAIERSLAGGDGKTVAKATWFVHLPIFLRDFGGAPACETLREAWSDRIEKQRKTAIQHLRAWYQNREKKPAAALDDALAALREGCTYVECQNWDLLKSLKDVAAKEKLSKATKKAFDELMPLYEKELKDGVEAFAAVNAKVAKF